MDCPLGQKKVALVERWPLVEFQLYITIAVWNTDGPITAWLAYCRIV